MGISVILAIVIPTSDTIHRLTLHLQTLKHLLCINGAILRNYHTVCNHNTVQFYYPL